MAAFGRLSVSPVRFVAFGRLLVSPLSFTAFGRLLVSPLSFTAFGRLSVSPVRFVAFGRLSVSPFRSCPDPFKRLGDQRIRVLIRRRPSSGEPGRSNRDPRAPVRGSSEKDAI